MFAEAVMYARAHIYFMEIKCAYNKYTADNKFLYFLVDNNFFCSEYTPCSCYLLQVNNLNTETDLTRVRLCQ